ncbi:MAG: Rha family transcriptional regulator [Marinobacterium sp.]|nr:Rha family transcriptional regulator [Marinobacterium sp.]
MATTPTQTASAELNPLDLISIDNNSATTTSFKVAKVFGKQHHNVLRKIKDLGCSEEFAKLNFEVCFKNNELQNGKPQPYYKMTKNGFVLLAMGFTTQKAMKFKEDYIAAFDWMAEKLLKQQSAPTPSTPSEPPIDTAGPHWMQIDNQPVITFRGIIAIHGYQIGRLNYLYHKHESRFARHSWLLAASNERFQQLKDQGQLGCIVRLFDAEGYRLLLQLHQNEYQPRLPGGQGDLLPEPEPDKPVLQFHTAVLHPVHRLPFISGADDPSGCSFWDVPMTGGYSGGLQTGRALALIYLNHMANRGDAGGCLSDVVLALIRTSGELDSKTRLGQVIGFFKALDDLLTLLKFGESVHGNDQDLLDLANDGLDGVIRE